MSGLDRLLSIAALTLLVGGSSAAAPVVPDEPREGGTLLLPGRLPWGTTSLPTGEILAPCEDQSLSVLDAQAGVLAQWQATARFAGPVTVGPRSAFQLVAAPLITGRVDVLVWDPRTRVLAATHAIEHKGEAVATAWGIAGTLYVAWKDGQIEAWSPQGARLWEARTGFETHSLLVDDNLGVYAFGPGRVSLFDQRGREAAGWPLEGSPRGVLQTMGGDLYCWTTTGLWKKDYDSPGFVLFVRATEILGVVVDRQDSLVVTEPSRLRRLSAEGGLLSTLPLPRPALAASTLDDRGRVLVPTAQGLEVWAYDGRLLRVLGDQAPVSGFQMGDGGVGSWGSADWRVHVWTGFRWPAFGWPQDGGSPGRQYSARRPATVAVRAVNWTEDGDFNYFYQRVASGEEAQQSAVLDLFEAKAQTGELLTTWPFANLILLKVARSGLTDLIMDRNRLANSWPGLRLRAYELLSQTAGPEDREELLALLQREHDPAVAAKGTFALARSGWDGDGRLMQTLAELQGRMAAHSVVADAVMDAAKLLWLANGQSADPVMVPLVTAVFQGAYPRAIKQKAQQFFQDLMASP